jgi:hypothetical protein
MDSMSASKLAPAFFVFVTMAACGKRDNLVEIVPGPVARTIAIAPDDSGCKIVVDVDPWSAADHGCKMVFSGTEIRPSSSHERGEWGVMDSKKVRPCGESTELCGRHVVCTCPH